MRRLLALLLTFAAAGAGAGGFPRGAEVVVLTGLPGDVESETAFAAEVERLAEALARDEARPRRLYVLTDSGEAGTLPPGLDAEARPGDRRGFTALAEELRGVGGESRWVLGFRRSGAFARALRGAGREVLASEDEVAFKSDPVMMELVLELLRDEPGLSFAELGERLGRRVAAWYEEQHLARQEEPTLWIAEEPRRPRSSSRSSAPRRS